MAQLGFVRHRLLSRINRQFLPLFHSKNKKSNGCFRHRDVPQYKVRNLKNLVLGFDCIFQPSSIFEVVVRLLFGKKEGK